MKRSTQRMRLVLVALAVLALAYVPASAQQLSFKPGNANHIYDVGEKVTWTATLPTGVAAPAGPYTYTVTRNNIGQPVKTGTLDLSSGSAVIEVTSDEPAMLWVRVTPPAAVSAGEAPAGAVVAAVGASPATQPGERGAGRGGGRGARGGGPRGGGMTLGAAVAPTKLQPSVARPADFDSFWDAKIKQLDAIPMNAVITPGAATREGVEFNVFKADSVGSQVHGYFAKPKREGKFPAIVIYQWAGVYALSNTEVQTRASEGWLALNIDSHDKEPSAGTGPPGNYPSVGNTSRETSYFLNMYLRDYRAIQYITSRPEWDGKTLVVMGTSMGGQQSLSLAGLHPKVTHLIVLVPSGADSNGSLHARQAGYPNWPANNPQVMETALYFDTVNFASRIKATSLVAMGFIDTISPPAGVWTAFNQIQGKKEAAPMPLAAHNNQSTAEQMRRHTERSMAWLNALVKGEAVKVDEAQALPMR